MFSLQSVQHKKIPYVCHFILQWFLLFCKRFSVDLKGKCEVSKAYIMFFRIYPGFLVHYVDQWWYIDVHVGWSPWILAGQYKGPSSEATGPACTLWSPSTFNQLKYRGIYPIVFQCGPSVAEGCPNQNWVFYTNSGTFQMLQINIEITVVIAPNTKRRRNVVLMFGQRRRQ